MRKIYLISLILVGVLALSASVLAKGGSDSLLAGLVKIAQEILPEGEKTMEPEEFAEMEEFVNPQEVQQVLREMKDLKREGKRILKKLQKLPTAGEDVAQMNNILNQIANFESKINSGVDLRDNIEEFRDSQFWDELNKLRAKVEIPKEMKQWTKEIKRTERLLKQKSFQKLGLDLEKAKIKLEEMKAGLNAVQNYYQAGDLESAIDEFDGLREDFHPGEINGVMYRMKDLKKMLKGIKDQEVKAMVEEVLQEVIEIFNEGDYRLGRETLDENFDELAKIINKAIAASRKKIKSADDFSEMTEKVKEKMQQRIEEKSRIEEQKQIEEQNKIEAPVSEPTPAPVEPQPQQPTTESQPQQ